MTSLVICIILTEFYMNFYPSFSLIISYEDRNLVNLSTNMVYCSPHLITFALYIEKYTFRKVVCDLLEGKLDQQFARMQFRAFGKKRGVSCRIWFKAHTSGSRRLSTSSF